MTEPSAWVRITQEDPNHSAGYIQRWKDLAAQGMDLLGEARLVDAMLARRSRVLDAGCGQGRIGGHLSSVGHDVVVCAGNVMMFLAPSTRGEVLRRLRAHVADGGRAAIGFGGDRGYSFDEFLADAQAAGWAPDLLLSTWDLRPFTPNATFLVAILRPA